MNCGAVALLRTLQPFKVTCCVKRSEASWRAAGRWPTCRSSWRTTPQSTWNGSGLPPSRAIRLATGRQERLSAQPLSQEISLYVMQLQSIGDTFDLRPVDGVFDRRSDVTWFQQRL